MCFEITNNCLKLAYHDPRPYWISSQILSYSCSKHYGNPSGHAMWTMGISLAVVMDISRSNPHSKLFAWLSCFIALFIGISVGASRLYLGAHSLDQVIYGWLLGIWLATTAEYTFKKSLMNHI
jgi:membrane-associated phospholipid phosphatase